MCFKSGVRTYKVAANSFGRGGTSTTNGTNDELNYSSGKLSLTRKRYAKRIAGCERGFIETTHPINRWNVGLFWSALHSK